MSVIAVTVAKVVQEDVHEVPEVEIVDLEGFILRVPWHKWAIETGAGVVAHVVHKGTGLEPVSWFTDLIAFEDLELGLRLGMLAELGMSGCQWGVRGPQSRVREDAVKPCYVLGPCPTWRCRSNYLN